MQKMSIKGGLFIALALLILAILCWQFFDAPDAPETAVLPALPEPATTKSAGVIGMSNPALSHLESDLSETADHDVLLNESDAVSEDSSAVERIDLNTQAVEAFGSSITMGDDRAPPIGTTLPESKPDESQLEDQALYHAWEADQERKLKRLFVVESGKQIESLKADIDRARSEGMAEKDIEVGLEKIRRLEQMQQELKASDPALTMP